MGTNKALALACLLHPCIALLYRFNTHFFPSFWPSDTWSVKVSLVLILTPRYRSIQGCKIALSCTPVYWTSKQDIGKCQPCTIEAVGVIEPFTCICYSHDFAFGLVKIKLCPVIEPVEICLEIITVFRICDDSKNCTVTCKETNSWAQTNIKIVDVYKRPKNGPLWDSWYHLPVSDVELNQML